MASIEQKVTDTMEMVTLVSETVVTIDETVSVLDGNVNTVGRNVVATHDDVKALKSVLEQQEDKVKEIITSQDTLVKSNETLHTTIETVVARIDNNKDLLQEIDEQLIAQANSSTDNKNELTAAINETHEKYTQTLVAVASEIETISTTIAELNMTESLENLRATLERTNERLDGASQAQAEDNEKVFAELMEIKELLKGNIEDVKEVKTLSDSLTVECSSIASRLSSIEVKVEILNASEVPTPAIVEAVEEFVEENKGE